MARGRVDFKQNRGESDKDYDLRCEIFCQKVSQALSKALTTPTDQPAGWNKAVKAIKNKLAEVKVEFSNWAPSPGAASVLVCTYRNADNAYDLTLNTANGRMELGEADSNNRNRQVIDLGILLKEKRIVHVR